MLLCKRRTRKSWAVAQLSHCRSLSPYAPLGQKHIGMTFLKGPFILNSCISEYQRIPLGLQCGKNRSRHRHCLYSKGSWRPVRYKIMKRDKYCYIIIIIIIVTIDKVLLQSSGWPLNLLYRPGWF